MATWVYSETANRYRDTTSGRFLSRQTILSYRDAIVDRATNRTAELAKAVSDGTITPSDFAAELRKVTKQVYLTQYELGRGGVNALTRSDIGKLGNMLRDQYAFIDGFQRDIEAGLLADADAIANRAALYPESSVAGFEQGNASARDMDLPAESPPVHPACRCSWRWTVQAGKHVAFWVVRDGPCPQCSALAAQYQPWKGREAA